MGRRARTVQTESEFDYGGYLESLEMEKTFNGDVDYPDDVPLLEDEEEEELDPEEEFDAEEFLRAEDTLDDDLAAAEEESDISDNEIDSIINRVDLSDVQRVSMSFDDLVPKKKPRTGIINQRKEKRFQQGLLVIREAVILTPSTCKRADCTFDAARALGFKKAKDIKSKPTKDGRGRIVSFGKILKRGTFWDSVPANKRKLVLTALKKHQEDKHTHQDESMFDEADRPGSWLSPGLMP